MKKDKYYLITVYQNEVLPKYFDYDIDEFDNINAVNIHLKKINIEFDGIEDMYIIKGKKINLKKQFVIDKI